MVEEEEQLPKAGGLGAGRTVTGDRRSFPTTYHIRHTNGGYNESELQQIDIEDHLHGGRVLHISGGSLLAERQGTESATLGWQVRKGAL